MPSIVDHDLRRLEIAAAVERIIAQMGMQAVTIREVGREAGYSPAIMAHYFRNKQDLLTFTYVTASRKATSRVESALLAGESLLACLKECLPTDAGRQAEWQVWFGYWGMATANPFFAEKRRNGAIEARKLFAKVLAAAQTRGDIPEDLDCKLLSTRVQFIINGIASLVLQEPKSWPAKRQVEMLSAEIELLKHYAAVF